MGRPKKNRLVKSPPSNCSFKPVGTPASGLSLVNLSLDEYEAIRLADYLSLGHAEAAEEMEISRSTFTRLIERARKKMAEFLIEGRLLQIEGGNIHFKGNRIQCSDCGLLFEANFNSTLTECPICGSDKLIDLAGSFGHGRCCRNHKNR
jgi:predicted DNA-binding protein (UPF0251 family)